MYTLYQILNQYLLWISLHFFTNLWDLCHLLCTMVILFSSVHDFILIDDLYAWVVLSIKTSIIPILSRIDENHILFGLHVSSVPFKIIFTNFLLFNLFTKKTKNACKTAHKCFSHILLNSNSTLSDSYINLCSNTYHWQ